MLKFISLYDSEKSYRADKSAWNYTTIKNWTKKTARGWKKLHIDGNDEDEKITDEMKAGSLLDCRLLENDQIFDSKYHITGIEKKLTPNNKKFVDNLYKLTLQETDENGVFIGDFSEIFQKAYDLAEIKSPKFPKFLEEFTGSETEQMYQEMRSQTGKTCVTIQEIESADQAAKTLKTHPNTSWLFKLELKTQVPIKFEYNDVLFRAMIDILGIDHENKEIHDIDLKTNWQALNFENTYSDLCYYYQDGIYSKAVEAFRDEFYPEYTIKPFSFMVIGMLGLYDPVIHRFEFGFGADPWTGFKWRGWYRKGIWQIIEEIEWCKETGNWGTNKEFHNNNGVKIHLIGE